MQYGILYKDIVVKNVRNKKIKYKPFPLAHSKALIPTIPRKVVAILPHNENIPNASLRKNVS